MENSYEINSLWSSLRNDISTHCLFDILNDYSPEALLHIIQEPMEYNADLRRISRRLYSSNGILRNTIDYMSSIPSLDYVITNHIKDDLSKQKKETLNFVLNSIKHKEIIRDAILESCIDGIVFYYFVSDKIQTDKRKSMAEYDAESISEINAVKKTATKTNASVISLPVDYCRITGRKNNSFVVSFNLEYFDSGLERAEYKLKKYPSEFAEGYNLWKSGKSNQFLILDYRKTMVHKISSGRSEPWGRPLVLAAIADILYSDYYKNTKRNVLDNVNNKIFYETFPEGELKGTSSLSDEKQKEQHATIKNAILSKNNIGGTSFFSVAAGTKIDSLTVDTGLFENDCEPNLSTAIGTDLGFAASLLNASGDTSFSSQQTNLDLVTSQIFGWIEQISNELNKVINYNVFGLDYVDVKVNYLPISHLNRSESFNFAKDLFTYGRGSLAYLAACAGISKEVYFALLDEQIEERIMEKYPVNSTSFNTSGNGESKSGRPVENNPTNENTIKSKANNSNNVPRP